MDGSRMIQSWIAVGAAEALRLAGLTDGEISDRQARKVYGKWFADAVAAGRIKPVRVGTGRTSTKHYRVSDILAYKAQCYTPAELIYK
jgi:hypothetical protein